MYSIIHNDVLPVDLEMVVGILSDAVKGLRYLHEAKPPLIHGDLKLMNILVDDRLTGKLSDFGLSCIQQGNSGVRGGSLLWMAPELLMETHPPSEMSDVYSLGITSESSPLPFAFFSLFANSLSLSFSWQCMKSSRGSSLTRI